MILHFRSRAPRHLPPNIQFLRQRSLQPVRTLWGRFYTTTRDLDSHFQPGNSSDTRCLTTVPRRTAGGLHAAAGIEHLHQACLRSPFRPLGLRKKPIDSLRRTGARRGEQNGLGMAYGTKASKASETDVQDTDGHLEEESERKGNPSTTVAELPDYELSEAQLDRQHAKMRRKLGLSPDALIELDGETPTGEPGSHEHKVSELIILRKMYNKEAQRIDLAVQSANSLERKRLGLPAHGALKFPGETAPSARPESLRRKTWELDLMRKMTDKDSQSISVEVLQGDANHASPPLNKPDTVESTEPGSTKTKSSPSPAKKSKKSASNLKAAAESEIDLTAHLTKTQRAALISSLPKDSKTGFTKASSLKDALTKQTPGAKTKKSSRSSESPKAESKRGQPYSIHYVNCQDLELEPIEKPQPPVPRVQYGLDRVLFNPGVYHMQCPRTEVYNFDPYLSTIMPTEEFDFNALKRYVTSSKDQTLVQLASSLGKKYTGSTSSMTSTLAHFHYLISNWRPINPKNLSREVPIESTSFTRIMRAPAAAFLHYKDGTYAIDADKEFDKGTILSMLGKSMEKLLTLPKDEFENYHRDRSHLLSDAAREDPEAFHYTTMGDFLMRSQLDAHDHRLPGTGMFDLKTRAVLSIRMESNNIKKGLGYEIRKRFGEFESFEREYLDMIRSAFLKYSLQVRMGRMDGIFVAFHNTERIFGFQYVPLEEMDFAIHGTSDRRLGDSEFKLSLALLNKVLDKATARFPGKSLRLHFETRPRETPFMYIFAKPVSDEDIAEVQEANKAAIEKFEQEMMGLDPPPTESELDQDQDQDQDQGATEEVDLVNEDEEGQAAGSRSDGEINQEMWGDMMARVEDAMDDDAQGIATVREAIEQALEESGLLANISAEESQAQIDALLTAIASNDAVNLQRGIVSADGTGSEAASAREAAVDNEGEMAPSEESEEKASAEDDGKALVGENAEVSLKDFIIKLATQAPTSSSSREAPSEDDGEPVAPKDTRRIKKFERILVQMLSGSKESGGNKDDHAVAESSSARDLTSDLKAADKISNEAAAMAASKEQAKTESGKDELLGMVLTTRNIIKGGKFVERLGAPTADWSIAYSIEEMSEQSAGRLYQQVKERRRKELDNSGSSTPLEEQSERSREFFKKLHKLAERGRKHRAKLTQEARARPLYVVDQDEPLRFEDVFEGGRAGAASNGSEEGHGGSQM